MSVNNTKNLQRNAPSLFKPLVVRTLEDPGDETITLNLYDANIIVDTAIDNTSSFKYNPPGTGLRSTQQLTVDWSDFANHTFFNSAQVKVNVAFDKIQNGFPFDGTQKSVEIFLDKLTGFEKYVYDEYPKNVGYLFFSGTNVSSVPGYGTYVTVVDQAGAAYTDISKRTDGKNIINPLLNPMTIEYWIYLPTIANTDQTVLDKHSGSYGFLSAIDANVSTTTTTNTFYVFSGSVYEQLSVPLTKGEWTHIAWVWNRTPGYYNVSSYINGEYYNTTSASVEFDSLNVTTDLYIGSGSAVPLIGFTPTNTLSGALDELRIWHTIRTADEIYDYYQKSIYADSKLKLYYKFNEASGSNSGIVIDASSNGLHGNLSGDALLLKVRNFSTASIAGSSPVIYENIQYNPILFGNQIEVVSYRTNFYTSASVYDNVNPNIITKLMPRHYFLEGQVLDALETEEGDIVNNLISGDDPRTTKLGDTQILLLFLYTWAQFFDEIKLYTQQFVDNHFVDYNDVDTVPDQFLQQLARSQGIELPPLFTGASVAQFINALDIQNNPSLNELSLQQIQNQIWRRILVNLREIVTSKGTIHGIKTFIRATGIDPDNNFRIREYGGPTRLNLGYIRDSRNEISTLLNFNLGGLIQSPFLSSSRIEPGYPEIANTANDGLLTSGSWTYEGIYKFPINNIYNENQSLVRFVGTGSAFTTEALFANLIATSGSRTYTTIKTGSLQLYVRVNESTTSPYTILTLSGVDIFDGDKWNICFGRRRNDDGINSIVSSSYFLRASKNVYGEIFDNYIVEEWFDETNTGGASTNVWNNITTTGNASGSYFMIGSSSIDTTPNYFLNSISVPNIARETTFTGNVSQIRFWSKYITEEEYPEHVRNFKSIGVNEPRTNFNFVSYKSGSWQRLRIDASTDQLITQSNGLGEIDIFDFSQNNFHLSGTNFPQSDQVINPEKYYYSFISPKIDEANTIEKVRIRSFEQYEDVVATPWAAVTPVYEVPRSEQPTDSTKFSIDYSVVEALNQDIINIFATLDDLDNVIGAPELVFSPDYPGLAALREVYFNRLTDKINLKQFFEFYKWFDTNIGTFVSQLIPKKTKYFGTNFIIESHMLERSKFEYLFSELYLGDSNRTGLRDRILLQLLVGTFARY
ncbi:LamG domain-containing protein [bacterium]|nr:LamG domain-containing protein [Candidatus Elulimicrobium humile]